MPVAVGLAADGQPTPALRKKLAASGLEGIDPASLKRRLDGKAETLFADTVAPAVRAGRGAAGGARGGHRRAADPEGDELPARRRRHHRAVRAPGPRARGAARDRVVPVSVLGLAGRPRHARPPLRGRARHRARERGRVRATARAPRAACVAGFAERRAAILAALDGRGRARGRDARPRRRLRGAARRGDRARGDAHGVRRAASSASSSRSRRSASSSRCGRTRSTSRSSTRTGRLTEKFLLVSNLRPADPSRIVQGNERVVRPRLADARFFYQTDRKTKLAERVPQLATIVYHGKLGTQLERVERLRKLATRIQMKLPRGAKGMPYADRAALLAKADLVTLMVGEFPELQGIMGKYYAAGRRRGAERGARDRAALLAALRRGPAPGRRREHRRGAGRPAGRARRASSRSGRCPRGTRIRSACAARPSA